MITRSRWRGLGSSTWRSAITNHDERNHVLPLLPLHQREPNALESIVERPHGPIDGVAMVINHGNGRGEDFLSVVFIPNAAMVLQPQPPASSLAATKDGDNASTWMSWAKRCRGKWRDVSSLSTSPWVVANVQLVHGPPSRHAAAIQRSRPIFDVILYVSTESPFPPLLSSLSPYLSFTTTMSRLLSTSQAPVCCKLSA